MKNTALYKLRLLDSGSCPFVGVETLDSVAGELYVFDEELMIHYVKILQIFKMEERINTFISILFCDVH
jgi:hypothetical protein